MQRIEFCYQVPIVSVPIGHALQGSNPVVDSLHWSAGDRVVVPVEDSRAIPLQSIRHCEQHPDSRGTSSALPVRQKSGFDHPACLLPDLAQVFLQKISHCKRAILVQCFLQSNSFVLWFIRIFRCFNNSLRRPFNTLRSTVATSARTSRRS